MNLTPVSADRAQVLLLFYKPKENDPFMNKLVAHFSPPFCHVELAFPERFGDEPWQCDIYGSSIFQDETVFYKKKTYLRDGYVCLTIEVSRAQQYRIKNYCKQQAAMGVPFNRWAMYGSYLPVFRSEHGTFCSKYIACALQHGGVVDPAIMDPARTTPSGLYAFLSDKIIAVPIVQVVPARMSQPAAASGARQTCKRILDVRQAQQHSGNSDRADDITRAMLAKANTAHGERDLSFAMTQAMTHRLVAPGPQRESIPPLGHEYQ